jgi:transcriptional regulator with PAS, ATPase and Fis domain
VHDLSPRSEQRFLTVPCGALPSDLIDSELFGHVKGAFTGADQTKEGKFEAASGGTILLDEIDVLALPQQAKLLRVLETGEFEAVGSNETRRANVRSIVASNVDLRDLVDQQRFRVDLYFRLNQICFEIPPLRNRTRDIVPLAISFIQNCCREHALDVRYVHSEFVAAIKACRWPGNIRQLRNEVRRAVLFCRDGVLAASHLSPEVRSTSFETGQPGEAMATPSGLAGEVAQREQMAIERMLRTQKFNRTATARALGISRVTLYNKIRKYGIRVDVTRRSADASTRNLN